MTGDGAARVWRLILDVIAGRKFRFISHRIITVVSITVTVSLLALIVFYTKSQTETIRINNERAMRNVTESISASLQTVMLAGYADIAQTFADRLKDVPGIVDFRIMRTDGNEAFRDNVTIEEVNKRRGQEDFEPRAETNVVPVLAGTHRSLRASVDELRIAVSYDTGFDNQRHLTFLAPILNEEKCHKCHGKASPVRGVLKLTTSLSMVEEDVEASWQQAGLILAAAVTIIMLVTAYLVRRSVVTPIVRISKAMTEVSRGELELAVPVLGRDELGQMAHSFNSMTDEVRRTLTGLGSERDKLTTIILSADEGMVVTNPNGDVVLANPASERILGKSSAHIFADGFDQVLDSPETIREWLARPGGVKDEVIEYNSRVLSITAATIRSPSGAPLGSTVLIRDITEAKRLENELRNRSLVDGLTGLGNRRFLDQALDREVVRTRNQGDLLSIAMFDIDHFKKFNDTYGHDQGDRVLRGVADCVRATVRVVDIPCRYGGEEFLVILRSTGREGAEVISERLRHNVETMELTGLPPVTISIGVATFQDFNPDNAVAFIECADQALYAAKRSGRNRVVVASTAIISATVGER